MDNSADDSRIDTYWKLLYGLYPILCKLVYSNFRIVTVSKVECLFSVMNSVLGKHTTRLNMETVSIIQTIKYYLKTRRLSSASFYDASRDNYAMNPKLYRNILYGPRCSILYLCIIWPNATRGCITIFIHMQYHSAPYRAAIS